jgi:nucleotide-binding universal stress UspA family protein
LTHGVHEATPLTQEVVMTGTHPSFIVVGVDGTSAGQAALAFAMREAAVRGSALEVVTTWQWNPAYYPSLGDEPADVRRRAQEVQYDAISAALACTTAPPVISRRVVEGEAGPVLVDVAHDADYLAVGTEHKNALSRVILGSVSLYCMRHAVCPVVVVPAPRPLADGHPTGERQLDQVL